MTTVGYERREVPVDILPPVPKGDPLPPAPPMDSSTSFKDLRTFYHPASGAVILAIDWLVFGTDLFTGFLALPAMCVLGFLFTFAAVFAIQRKWSNDHSPAAMGKAFIGAFLVGLPFPITGTLLGAAILGLAGLPRHPAEAIKRLIPQVAK